VRTWRGILFRLRTYAIFGAKRLGFFEIYGVFTRTREVSLCGHFEDKEEMGNFSRLCADVFDGQPPIFYNEKIRYPIKIRKIHIKKEGRMLQLKIWFSKKTILVDEDLYRRILEKSQNYFNKFKKKYALKNR